MSWSRCGAPRAPTCNCSTTVIPSVNSTLHLWLSKWGNLRLAINYRCPKFCIKGRWQAWLGWVKSMKTVPIVFWRKWRTTTVWRASWRNETLKSSTTRVNRSHSFPSNKTRSNVVKSHRSQEFRMLVILMRTLPLITPPGRRHSPRKLPLKGNGNWSRWRPYSYRQP